MGSVKDVSSRCPFQSPRELFGDLAALRARDGLFHSEALNGWVVTRYDDIVEVLDQPELFSSEPTIPRPPPMFQAMFENKVPLRGTLLGLDNPDHDRLRLCVNSFFVPRKLQRFEPLMRKIAHDLIDDFIEDGSVNIKAEFALPLPLKVIAAVVGIDPTRWKWIGKSLAFFGGHPDLAEGSDEEKLQALFDLHSHCQELIEARRTDRRDDLISHIWNERDSGRVVMTDFEHLSMLPGLMLAGHETTTNLLSMALAHLLNTEQYAEAQKNDDSRAKALEELLRYESAITGMPRLATRDTTLSGQTIKVGERLFIAYNSGSRDEKYFPNSDQLDIFRKNTKQHLGFGRGIHACLGAPLARLLLKTELSVISERLPCLRLLTSYQQLPYLHIGEGRGLEELWVAWDVSQVSTCKPYANTQQGVSAAPKSPSSQRILQIEETRMVANDIICIKLRTSDKTPLPVWSAGSHIDIQVGDLGWRQYSLCSDPEDKSWEIAVLRERNGTGGSEYLHKVAKVGVKVTTRGPRNHFKLLPAQRYIFIAGGVGITPFHAMITAAKKANADFHIYYLGRHRSGMAFVDDVAQCGSNATIWPSSERGRFDLSFLKKTTPDDLKIYCCGPARLNAAVEEACSHLPAGVLSIERFQNDMLEKDYQNNEIEVVLAKSALTLRVPPERSILDVLNETGAGIMSTCQKGTCGTCEVKVLEGVPDHRDTVLSSEEKAENGSMMVCVSRCLGSRLVLDW